ncbi:MAG: hypothetical protein L0323_12945 [Planctomycetes bacterium]|nr:hypothetical protein [Planctomycetota bacterium]
MRLLPFFAALAALASPSTSQTTGVCGANDLLVNGAVPGSTSCVPSGPWGSTPITLSVDGSPAAVATIFVISTCPCFAGALCRLASPTTCPGVIPFTACGATTNQSLDVICGAGCVCLFLIAPNLAAPACPTGVGRTTATLPLGPIPPSVPPGFVVSVQAAVFEVPPLCASPTWGVVKTQAYDIFK